MLIALRFGERQPFPTLGFDVANDMTEMAFISGLEDDSGSPGFIPDEPFGDRWPFLPLPFPFFPLPLERGTCFPLPRPFPLLENLPLPFPLLLDLPFK